MNDRLTVLSDEDVESHANGMIAHLDDNFSPDNAGQVLADMLAINEASKWAIGDIMVYTRLRLGKNLVGKTETYIQAIRLAEERYGQHVQMFPSIDILDWEIFIHEPFWILKNGDGSCRVWEVTESYIDEKGFNQWLIETCYEKVGQLSSSWKTIANRYRVSLAWPRSKRNPAWAWSMHAELANLAGGSIEAGNNRGLARLPEKAAKIDDLIEEIEKEGPVTIGKIREKYRQMAGLARGYYWVPPMPRNFYIHDRQGQSYLVLQFADMDEEYDPQIAIFQIWILQLADVVKPSAHLRLGTIQPDKIVVDQALTKITTRDGRLVATIVNKDIPLVMKAVEDLVLKLES